MSALHRETTASDMIGEGRATARYRHVPVWWGSVGVLWAVASLLLMSASGVTVARPGPPPGHRPSLVDRPGLLDYPPIWLDLALDAPSSSWRTQYRPDDYRLPGYDGKSDGAHFCRGAHGRSLSTAGMTCPQGQKPDKGTRHLSTDLR